MSLDGAKLICLGKDDGEHNDVIPARGKTFKFGYYMDCDVVLEHPDALGRQCTIDCDAFGRVTIANLSKDEVIKLNGKPLKKLRPLLHNTEICIFDKKFLWLFEKDENLVEYATPSKQIKKAEQPPNSEPGCRWRTHDKRLTIHTFSYSIKSGQESKTEKTKTDRNKSPNSCQTIETNSSEPTSTTRDSPVPSAMDDLIDLETPKPKQRSFAGQRTPLICCSFSEIVITSYSPHDNGVRAQAKSYAVVQSPAGTPRKLGAAKSNVTLEPFKQTASPLVLSQRPSMHLIDLTTPMKRSAPESPLKNVHKKNRVGQLRISQGAANTSVNSSASTVFSVHSTDEESVIELSDEGSFSPSPVLKTPPRPRTPQSLMKRAILSSAKKAIRKPLQPPAAPPPPIPSTPKSPTTTRIRFQSLSTPQRKSLAGVECSPADRTKASKSVVGKFAKSMVTSTPFRAEQVGAPKRRSSILRSPSTSLMEGNNKSRTSLMLRQALKGSPKQNKTEKSSLILIESLGTPSKDVTRLRKSVSFLDHAERERSVGGTSKLNETFSIEEIEDCTNEPEDASELKPTPRKDATFSPEKTSSENLTDDCIVVPSNETAGEKALKEDDTKDTPLDPDRISEESNSRSITDYSTVAETPIKKDAKRRSSIKPLPGVTLSSEHRASTANVSSALLESPRKNKDSFIDAQLVPQTPQSSKSRLKKTPLSVKPSSAKNLRNIMDEEDFEGLDAVFKTPKARNLMILSSPKSIALQKPSTDSVELMHSTEFDLSTNLDALFKTPQSELVINRTDAAITTAADEGDSVKPVLSPEEAFDNLVGRSTVEKNYSRKKSTNPKLILPLDTPRDPDLPKTDIEEWIEKVNQSLEHSDVERDEDEMSYLTANQSEVTRDPLMMSTVSEGVTTASRREIINKSLSDEIAMTIRKGEQEIESVLKDPLEVTIVAQLKKSISPNISGIDLLDHSSESAFSETLAISDDSSEKENSQHVVSTIPENTVTQIERHAIMSPNNARREIEEAFENFERERRILEDKRLVSTPEPRKVETNTQNANRRKTLGNSKTADDPFDVKAAKENWEKELAFENFEEEPVVTTTRAAMTPDAKKASLKDRRRTMGTKFVPEKELDLEAAKAEREMELDFENFKEEPVVTTTRAAMTPDAKKASLKDRRRTMGTKFIPEKELDLEAAKAEREMELAFENFKEEPLVVTKRSAKTPDAKKSSVKDHRRTMGTKFVPEKELDLEAAKAEREMELAFENFEEEPVVATKRSAKTPDAKKSSVKDHRRTMGTKFVPEKELDLEAAKAEREMELAFENFEEEPVVTTTRAAMTPDAKKSSLKDRRRTMGTKFVPEKELDLEAAKAEREMELAFENFEEEPVVATKRSAKTPDAKKSSLKDRRRTMGTKFVPEKELDLEAAKAEREMELAFENFEEEPVVATKRSAKTPEAKKLSLKDLRRTMGTNFVPEKQLDLGAAKAEREMELAFENFEEEPVVTITRAAMTPDAKKSSLKDLRRTMGTKFVPEKELDLEAAKAEREMELAFENFEEEPVVPTKRSVKTPDAKKSSVKDLRRTIGTKFVPEKKLDLEAAKAEREMELAFENFEEEPVVATKRSAKTPDAKKSSVKDHRRTMGTNFVPEKQLDLEAAKAEREMELAFENFEEEPVVTITRAAMTPDAKKSSLKDRRRTMGTKFVPEKELDLEAAKAEREMELAFENFEEEPVVTMTRAAMTPDAKKSSLKDHRRTMGTKFLPEKELDLETAKVEREMELAFENFEEEPVVATKRSAKTPDAKKSSVKDHRRTMGTKFVPEKELDLEAAKAEREMELAFENFEEEPVVTTTRAAITPNAKKSSLKDLRRTMGTKFVPEKELDLEAAKAEREMELAFENFEEEPVVATKRSAKTPEAKKSSLKDLRRTIGTKFVPEKKLDLEAAKAEREMELAFENFEEEPVVATKRSAKTPEAKKLSLKDLRRTMGTNFVPEKQLDLEAAKAEREMELAFENFEKEPVVTITRAAMTPDAKKSSLKDHRRTMGTKFVPEKELDLKAAKAEREMELAFENFKEEPVVPTKRSVKTPDVKKSSVKDHRRTMGTKFVPEKELDLEAAKAEREMELAFENFEEEPVVATKRCAKTPEAKKLSLKDLRRTMGTKFVPEKELDLKAVKVEREIEVAFENFEEEPVVPTKRSVKTPDVTKSSVKDHRRTMGTKFVPEKELDLEAAKAEREMELAFENFEEEPVVAAKRSAKTPDAKKSSLKDHRRTMGTKFLPEKELDLETAKVEREMELAFENFEEEPVMTTKRSAKTPEVNKISLADHRRTIGTKYVPDIELNLAQEKRKRDKEFLRLGREKIAELNEVMSISPKDQSKLAVGDTSSDKTDQRGGLHPRNQSVDISLCSAKKDKESDAVPNEGGEQTTKNVDEVCEHKTRRRRQNTVGDTVQNSETGIESSLTTKTESARPKRKRLNSLDTAASTEQEHKTDENAEAQKVQLEGLKRHRIAVDKQSEPQIESTDVESKCEDDEAKHEKLKIVESLQAHKADYQHLEPITNEVKKQNYSAEELKKTSKQEDHIQSTLNLQAEVDKNVEDPHKCTRSVALNVVLLKSTSSRIKIQIDDVSETDSKTTPIKRELDTFEEEVANKNVSQSNHEEKHDTDEVILSTPATKGSQRRRPQRKLESVNVSGGLGLRRTRRGSVQQDVEVKIEPVDPREMSHSTPVPSVVHLRAEAIPSTAEKLTPVRRRGRKPAEVEDIGEAIPSTPLPPKTRGRRVAQLPGVTSSFTNKDTKVIDEEETEGGVNSASVSEHNVQTEVDEVVPSTPLQQVRRGRKPKSAKKPERQEESSESTIVGTTTYVKVENDENDTENEKKSPQNRRSLRKVVIEEEHVPILIEGIATEDLNKADNLEKSLKAEDTKTEQDDVDVEERTEKAKETRVASKTRGRRAAVTRPRKRGVEEVLVNDVSAVSEIEKLDVKDEKTSAEEADGVQMLITEDLIENETLHDRSTEAHTVVLPSKGRAKKRCISETAESHAAEKEHEEIEAEAVETIIVPSTSAPTKTRSRRNANKDEEQKAPIDNSVSEPEPTSKLSARIRSRKAAPTSDQTNGDNLTPMTKKRRGRPAKNTAPVEPPAHLSSEHKFDGDEYDGIRKPEELKEDPIVTSTPGRRRGRKGVLEKDAPVPEEVSASNPVQKRRSVEQDPEIKTGEDAEKSLPTRKRGRRSDAKSESKESQVNTSAKAELIENDSEVPLKAEVSQASLGNKKRARVETVKSEQSESKTQSPLRKRGRRPENTPVKSEVTQVEALPDQDTNVDSVQPNPEKEEKTEKVAEKRGRGRKLASGTVPDKIASDTEVVKIESEGVSEKRPSRTRRVAVKDNPSMELSSFHTHDEVSSKAKSTPVATDVEPQNTKSEDTLEKKPTRSRRAPAKSSANVSTSHAGEDITHKIPSEGISHSVIPSVEVIGTESEDRPTRGRRAPAKMNTSVEVSFLTEAASKADTAKTEPEENSIKRPTRVRRVPAKYDTSVEVFSSHTDDEYQKSKPSTRPGRAKKTEPKSVFEDAAATISQHNTSAEVSRIEDAHQEPEGVRKPARSRKVANLQDSKAEEKHTPTLRGRKPTAKTDTEDDAVEKQTQKPTRGKREVQPKAETPAAKSSKVIAEETETPSLPKRTARTRKAAPQNEPSESEDEDHHQKDSTKKTSRSRKVTEPTLEDEAKVSKRGNRHIQEVLPDDSSSTPKRSRRKLKT